MYRKILVPLDGSTAAEKVLPHVLDLARTHNAEIVLFQVPLYAYADETAHTKRLMFQKEREQAVLEARKYLNKVRSNLIRLGVRASTAIEEGQAAPRIIDYASKSNVDVIAMVSQVQNSWHRIVYGSVIEEVMRGSGKPVLLINLNG
jgi:nucleotide-binding universal stress UspA family protein